MNQMFTVFGRSLCEACGNQELSGHGGGIQPGDVVRQIDPTVCSKCAADEGSRELPRVAGLPFCGTCEDELRRRPFPLWIKVSFTLLLGLAAFSLIHNRRFLLGYVEMHRAGRAMAKRDVSQAAAFMSAAAAHVPEARELKDLADYFTGLDLMANDRAAEAVPLLQSGAVRLPPGTEARQVAEMLLAKAQAAVAFDAKDYDAFLAKETEMLKARPNDPMAMAGVASAHACKYAVTGDESHKQQALRMLESAVQADKGPHVADYRQRILFRLHTREIISKKEFDRRYPNGWNPEAKK
jgi:hypothetical protein